ncbi:MAG: hypothetical protein EP338_09550 [Bacteroidetes bacterium]|nr:MAG: hypothetical protein EP338_09550 [Bacteroidota bacterium]
MSSFLRRLKYYGIGFGLGLVFVFFFFQNRGCSWLPSNRVKNAILDRVITISDEEQKKLTSLGITDQKIIDLLNDGEVDFGKSKKKGKMKIYQLSREETKLYFTLPEECFISEVRVADQKSSKIKSTTQGTGRFIHFPKDESLVFVDTNRQLACQLEKMGYINQKRILKSLKKNGKIDFERSNFREKPKALVYLYFDDQSGKKTGAESIWYKNKINIRSFDLADSTLCR